MPGPSRVVPPMGSKTEGVAHQICGARGLIAVICTPCLVAHSRRARERLMVIACSMTPDNSLRRGPLQKRPQSPPAPVPWEFIVPPVVLFEALMEQIEYFTGVVDILAGEGSIWTVSLKN